MNKHDSQWAAITSIAEKIRRTAETLATGYDKWSVTPANVWD